ncbi:MAG: radical SAM protein [Candidatus Omnitrophica bacterium]|nr:radical SAM protein [Candidatus Omnitrophota bacterium]
MKNANPAWRLKVKRISLLSSYYYNKGIIELPYPPVEVFIEPTSHCNLKCMICPHAIGLERPKGFMSEELFDKIFAKVVKVGVLKVTLHFAGEPLLNKDIFRMIRKVKAHNIYVRLHTNGTIMPTDYARELIESGLDEISFSFDDFRKEVYEKIRQGASYEKTLANIRSFLEVKKGMHSAKPFTIIQRIRVADLNSEEEDVAQYNSLFAGLPIDKLHTIFTHNWAGVCKGALIKEHNARLNEKVPCNAIWLRCAIGWDGKVYACCNEMNGKLLIGELNSSSLMEIWNGPQMQNLRKTMLERRFDEVAACRDCDVLLRAKESHSTAIEKALSNILVFLSKR